MKQRDRNIIKDLERFRVMSRDDIADLYFSNLKYPEASANSVLKRLVRDNQIEVSQSFVPYVYFPHGSNMKRNSTKIPHFLEIVDVYRQFKKYINPQKFQVEPKLGNKGSVEPDAFTIIKGKQFFIELQRNIYSQKVMDEKIKRYESLYYSNEFKTFPYIIMITSTKYNIDSDDLTVFQVESINEFMNNAQKKQVKQIKYSIGG